jgi:hypothetical protein
MEKINRSDADLVSEALVLWVGPIPSAGYDGEAALVKRFGAQEAAKLLPNVRALEKEFFSSDARHVAANLEEMGDRAIADFRRVHPEISDEALNALANHYAFAFK